MNLDNQLVKKKISENSPVLLIAFLRPKSTIETLTKLQMLGVSEFYIAIDGARNSEEKKLVASSVAQIKSYCDSMGIEAKFKVSPSNLGIALSVVTALDWVFETSDTIIVFEDDLVFSNDFVDYCNYFLQTLKENNQVNMISGNNFFPEFQSKNSPLWTNYPLIWGWATWKNRWIEIRKIYMEQPGTQHLYFRDPSLAFFYTGYHRALTGRIDSWALPLAYQQYSQGKLTLIPPVNLVSNIGTDNQAIHTFESAWHMHHATNDYPGVYLDPIEPISAEIIETNKRIENYVFKISLNHLFSPVLSILFDRFRFAKPKVQIWKRLKELQLNPRKI